MTVSNERVQLINAMWDATRPKTFRGDVLYVLPPLPKLQPFSGDASVPDLPIQPLKYTRSVLRLGLTQDIVVVACEGVLVDSWTIPSAATE